MTNLGRLPEEVDGVTVPDALKLCGHWNEVPPTAEMLPVIASWLGAWKPSAKPCPAVSSPTTTSMDDLRAFAGECRASGVTR